MCNLYRMTKNKDEVAQWFGAIDELGGANFGAEVFPGYPGAVVAEGRLAQMTWGFPLVLKGKNGPPLKPRPVNNARTDKLDSFFWRYSFEERRCLIPVTAWAEAEGPKGGKTRTWLSRPDAELFAVAGVWRDSEEWGRCYSMVMTDACGRAEGDPFAHAGAARRRRHRRLDRWRARNARALCASLGKAEATAEPRTGVPWSGRGQVSLL